MNTCLKCGRKYSAPPAISRVDRSEICPVCGAREAIERMPGAEEAIRVIEESEIKRGRVCPLGEG